MGGPWSFGSRPALFFARALEDVACLEPEARYRDTLHFGIPSGTVGGCTSIL